MQLTRDPANFREYAASLACFILIIAAIAMIFAIILVPVYTGKAVILPEAAGQFFFGLVMAAIGYLIGKQTTGPVTGAAGSGTMTLPVGDVTARVDVQSAEPKP